LSGRKEIAEMIIPMNSNLQTNEQGVKKCTRKAENSRKVISKNIMCFKIMKVIYKFVYLYLDILVLK